MRDRKSLSGETLRYSGLVTKVCAFARSVTVPRCFQLLCRIHCHHIVPPNALVYKRSFEDEVTTGSTRVPRWQDTVQTEAPRAVSSVCQLDPWKRVP